MDFILWWQEVAYISYYFSFFFVLFYFGYYYDNLRGIINFFFFFFGDRKRNFIRREEKITKEDKTSSQRKQKLTTKSGKIINKACQSYCRLGKETPLNRPWAEHQRVTKKAILSQIKSTVEEESLKIRAFFPTKHTKSQQRLMTTTRSFLGYESQNLWT